MASITAKAIASSTLNVNSYATGSFSPTAGELLFVIAHGTGTVASDSSITASANGLTFSKVADLVLGAGGHLSTLYVADQVVPASPVSMTITVNYPTDAATGCFIAVGSVSGLTRVGAAAVKRIASNANIVAGAAYSTTFSQAVSSSNPIAGFVGHGGANAITPPTGWTEQAEPVDQATPTQGFEWASIDSGASGTTFTWGTSTTTTRANVGAIEFDSSAALTVEPKNFFPLL